MPQFLLSPESLAEKTFTLTGPEAFHVARVLRAKPGDAIELFDGRGGRYRGVIRELRADGSVAGEITGELIAPESALPVELHLHLGLIKPSHWEWALEKGTELGVASFTPVITPRTVVRLRELGAAKAARWGKILAAAAKQSGRARLPALREPAHFRDAIVAAKSELTLLAWERHAGASTYAGLRAVLAAARGERKSLAVNLFVGPEGGFSDEEIELAECEGAKLFSLGPATLRAETAALAACAVIFYELGSL